MDADEAQAAKRSALMDLIGAVGGLARAILLLAMGLLVLTFTVSCLAGGGADSVNWDEYKPGTQARIDGYAAQGNCAALQQVTDAVIAQNEPGRERAALMQYVSDASEKAGCPA